jgi:hypothetical protein
MTSRPRKIAATTSRIGDSADTEHCTALKHEFLRCQDAFKDFETYGTLMIMKAQAEEQGRTALSADEKRLIAYKTYNAYARFVLHLYEFMLGAITRENGTTEQLKGKTAERYIMGHVQRILTGRRQAILKGIAPAWENDISYFPEKVPAEFPREFRQLRNKITHVARDRSSFDLTDFYAKYHKYVHMLYLNCLGHWGLRNKEFPDLKQITQFSVLIRKSKFAGKSV